jgi:hypothetical protein
MARPVVLAEAEIGHVEMVTGLVEGLKVAAHARRQRLKLNSNRNLCAGRWSADRVLNFRYDPLGQRKYVPSVTVFLRVEVAK